MIKRIIILSAICALMGDFIAFYVAKVSPAYIYAGWWAIGTWAVIAILRLIMMVANNRGEPEVPIKYSEGFCGLISLAFWLSMLSSAI